MKKQKKYRLVYMRPNHSRYIKSFDTIEECVKHVCSKHNDANLLKYKNFSKYELTILYSKLFAYIQKQQYNHLKHFVPYN